MAHSFNLVDEGWIPCQTKDLGTSTELGLKNTLIHAHEIREVTDPSPLVTVALHRLLLAVLHRLFGPENLETWRGLWSAGKWDASAVTAYFDTWQHRFDLFDAQRPFYQVSEMASAAVHPATALLMEKSSGNNATLFDHSTDVTAEPLSAAQAARGLVALQAFSIGFGKSTPFYLSDSLLTRGLTVLVNGTNLFETLALNLLPYNNDQPLPRTGVDLPIWEQNDPAMPDHRGTPARGYLDHLTWQSRRVHLLSPDGSGLVHGCQIQQNLKLAGEPLDPFKCYVKDDDEGLKPLQYRPEKSLWRDSHVLFQEADRSFKRPEIFNWLARIESARRRGLVKAEQAYRFSAFGFATDAGKAASITFWRHEQLPLPLAYLKDKALLGHLRQALDLVDQVGRLLSRSERDLQELLLPLGAAPRRGLDESVKKLAPLLQPRMAVAGHIYWARLEVPFRQFLVELAADRREGPGGEAEFGLRALDVWADTVERVAREAFDEAAGGLDGSARALRALARAEQPFRRKLKAALRAFRQEEVTP